MKKKVLLVLLGMLLCAGVGASAGSAAASEGDFRPFSLQNEAAYTIRSDGAPFYFSFGRREGAAAGEVGRVSWIVSELNLPEAGGENAEFGACCTPSQEIGSGYGTGLKAESSAVDFASATGQFYSLVIYKTGAAAEADYILRSGINRYTQISLGRFADAPESCYGLYFSGVKIEITILVTFVYGTDFTLYASEGVTVVEYAERIEPDIVLKNAVFVESDNPDEMIRHPICTEKASFIPFMFAGSDSDTLTYYLDGIILNGEKADLDVLDGGGFYYIVCPLSAADRLEIVCQSRTVTLDEAEISDLIDVAGKADIRFSELRRSDIAVGNIPNRPNTAFRFRYNTPDTSSWGGSEINKFGMWTSNGSLWSNFGYIITFHNNTVRILSGEEREFASGACAAVRPRSTIEVVIGMVKGYDEQGNYLFNRIYVDVNGEEAVRYDDYARPALGSAIIGPYLEVSAAACSIENAVTVFSVTDATLDRDITVGFPPFVREGEEVSLTFVERNGKKITRLTVNGRDVTEGLTENGAGRVLTVGSVREDLVFSYLTESVVCAVVVEPAAGISADAGSSVAYGEDLVLSFVPRSGMILASVMVNGVDRTEDLERENGRYLLVLHAVKEDLRISLTAGEKRFSVRAEASETAGISVVADSVAAGGTAAFTVEPEEGYKISAVRVNGEPAYASDGVFYVYSVFEDLLIEVQTEPVGEPALPGGSGCVAAVLVPILAVAAAALVAASAFVLLRRKKERSK